MSVCDSLAVQVAEEAKHKKYRSQATSIIEALPHPADTLAKGLFHLLCEDATALISIKASSGVMSLDVDFVGVDWISMIRYMFDSME